MSRGRAFAAALLLSACSPRGGARAPAPASARVVALTESRGDAPAPVAAPTPSPRKGPSLPEPKIEVSARCLHADEGADDPAPVLPGGRVGCRHRGEEVVTLEVGITNRGTTEIGVPLGPLQARGPNIRLVDDRTGRSEDLRSCTFFRAPTVYTPLGPGRTVYLRWQVLTSFFADDKWRPVLVTGEISVEGEVRVGEEKVVVEGRTKLLFVRETKPRQ